MGLLNQSNPQQEQQPVAPQGNAAPQGGSPDYKGYLQDIESKVPPEFREAYMRLTSAGLKFMLAPESQQMIDETLKQDQQTPIGELVGKYVAGLMVSMLKKSNGAPPGQMVIPAGVELTIKAMQYVGDAGYRDVQATDLASAIETYIYTMMAAAGAKPEQFDAVIGSMGKGQQGQQPGGM
jgi:hypothetical protein